MTNHNNLKLSSAGTICTILEIYADEAYEIKFSHLDGSTIAWFAIPQNEVKPVTIENLVSASSRNAESRS